MVEPSNNQQAAPPDSESLASAVPQEWQHFSPSEIRELEAVRTERIKAETRLEELKQTTADLQKQNDELRQKQNVRAAILESGVKFHNSAEATQLLGEIEYDADHLPTVGGVPLSKALIKLALQSEFLADGRSLRALKEKAETEDKTPRSKADLKSTAETSAFIQEHGLAAFEALPLRPPVDLRGKLPKTWNEYVNLSTAEKARVINAAGSGFVGDLHRQRARS